MVGIYSYGNKAINTDFTYNEIAMIHKYVFKGYEEYIYDEHYTYVTKSYCGLNVLKRGMTYDYNEMLEKNFINQQLQPQDSS